jgi:hypothetical protein
MKNWRSAVECPTAKITEVGLLCGLRLRFPVGSTYIAEHEAREVLGSGIAGFASSARAIDGATKCPLPQHRPRHCRAGVARCGRTAGTWLYLEKAAAMANHASTRTTQLYDRRRDEVSLDEVERIAI